MDVALLKYPKRSHRKVVNIPVESPDLAELMGIALGDGGINNEWQLVITLNSIADQQYSIYVVRLLKSLFDVEVAVRKRKNRNALALVSTGTNLVDFLVEKGAVRGNKVSQQIDIPAWIRNKVEYEKSFVRGLVDTDGCLYIHRHTVQGKSYRNIGLCFSSGSRRLITSVAEILHKFNIEPHIAGQGRKIYLYSQKSVLDYLNIFGSSNPRIFQKYIEWTGA